jgi:hypothetical protein
MAPQAAQRPAQGFASPQSNPGFGAAAGLQRASQGQQPGFAPQPGAGLQPRQPLTPQPAAVAPAPRPAEPSIDRQRLQAATNAGTGAAAGSQMNLAALIRQLKPGLERAKR